MSSEKPRPRVGESAEDYDEDGFLTQAALNAFVKELDEKIHPAELAFDEAHGFMFEPDEENIQ